MNETEWKELEIGHIPWDLCINENYEIESYTNKGWMNDPYVAGERYEVIKNMIEEGRYRYRLNPLESIRITKKLHDMVFHYTNDFSGVFDSYDFDDKRVNMIDGRRVEIIL